MPNKKRNRNKAERRKRALLAEEQASRQIAANVLAGGVREGQADAIPQPVAMVAATPPERTEVGVAEQQAQPQAPPAMPTQGQDIPTVQPASAEAMTKSAGPSIEHKLPAEVVLHIHQLASAAWADEMRGLEEDNREIESSRAKAISWSERTKRFRDAMNAVVDFSARRFAECVKILNELPPELRSETQGKQEGLALTSKMLARLSARLPKDIETGAQELPTLGEARWAELLAGSVDETSAQARIKRELTEIASQRYVVVTRARETAGKARKALLGFVEKDVLPVLDALDDGERHSAPAIAGLKERHPGAAEQLDAWCSTYGKLRRELVRALDHASVRPIEVTVGAPILYDRHQPFDVEPDPTLPNEHIKALVRNGYEHIAEGGEACVLRAAQIVAVKNASVPDSPTREEAVQTAPREPASEGTA